MNRDRSLEELERDRWPAPPADATRLVAAAHVLRRQPIGELTVEDMRLLIRQDVGLRYLLPMALELLRENPLAEGDLYPGDLLSAVLTRDPAVWNESAGLRHELRVIVSGLVDMSPALQQDIERFRTASCCHGPAVMGGGVLSVGS
ncbi:MULTISPECIES: contact-dependent growth inhibition system immunity protein [unclassified Kitasatospora]|uniref:contact-dependent growth inhibition system immunity protein n=1 Tax=unclassified Kitasatospora TaxID=2633591 RepID=UPI0033CB7E54